MSPAVKICGITDEASLDTARAGGADYVGFVFFPKSPRNLTVERAKELRDLVPRNGAWLTIALVVDPTDTSLSEIIRVVDPDMIQLHGHETTQRVAQIRA